jgi:hypothetical protein
MSLSDRQLRGVHRLRGATGARIYVTDVEFWRNGPAVGAADLLLAPVMAWSNLMQAILSLQGDAEAVMLATVSSLVDDRDR